MCMGVRAHALFVLAVWQRFVSTFCVCQRSALPEDCCPLALGDLYFVMFRQPLENAHWSDVDVPATIAVVKALWSQCVECIDNDA